MTAFLLLVTELLILLVEKSISSVSKAVVLHLGMNWWLNIWGAVLDEALCKWHGAYGELSTSLR